MIGVHCGEGVGDDARGGRSVRGVKSWLPIVGAILVVIVGAAFLFPFARDQLAKLDPGPYPDAIKAEGVIDNDAAGGTSVYVFPEVPGTVADTYVREGDRVKAGQPLFALDDTVQRATTETLRQQAVASDATLRKLKAPPRPEQVAVAKAQVDQAKAALKAVADQQKRLKRSAELDARSVSKENLEGAADAVKSAQDRRRGRPARTRSAECGLFALRHPEPGGGDRRGLSRL